MPATIRIKRRAAGGAAGAPATLAAAELAFNEQDNTLYYGKGDNGSGVATSVVAIGGSGTFPSTGTGNTWSGTNNFSGNVSLGGTTAVTGTINFAGATIQNFPLDSLTDVNLGKTIALATGHMIAWDGTDWVNVPAPSGGGGGTLTSVVAAANSGVSATELSGIVTIAGIDATTTAKGVVQLADAAAITAGTAGLVVDAAQLLAATYTLPTASATVLGGVKVGTNLAIDAAGVLSATVPGALVFKGAILPTATQPAGAVKGDTYAISTAGTLDASWGLGAKAVDAGDLMMYTGTAWDHVGNNHATVVDITATLPISVDKTNPAQPGLSIADASTTAKGVVQLADATAITGGTANLVVDAAQLKVVNDRLPVGTVADQMLKWDATNTKWVVTAVIDCGTF